MTRFTRLLLWLLSTRSDVRLNVHVVKDVLNEDESAVDFLEYCYELDSAFHWHRPFYGEDPPRRGLYD